MRYLAIGETHCCCLAGLNTPVGPQRAAHTCPFPRRHLIDQYNSAPYSRTHFQPDNQRRNRKKDGFFPTDYPRYRLIFELMAEGGMCIGEVLKLRMINVYGSELFLVSPRSGRQNEGVSSPKRWPAGSGNISDSEAVPRGNEFFTSNAPEPCSDYSKIDRLFVTDRSNHAG